MEKRQILDILSWIFLIIGIILLIWYIFGNSPSELAITLTFLLTLMFKMWGISDDLHGFKHEARMSFSKVRNDIGDIRERVESIEGRKKQ